MRKALLSLAVLAVLALPASAQFRRFTPTEPTGLLGLKPVQDELKLTDEQKKAVEEANDELQKAFRALFQDQDLGALVKAQAEHRKAVQKVIDKLDDKQKDRLSQIEFQASVTAKSPRAFANPYVEKQLKLTSDQKKTVKDTIAELDKDFKEMDDDAKDDVRKFFTNFVKKQKKNAEAYDKIVESLDADQKKSFDKVGGDKIDLKVESFFPKKDDKEKKDK